MQSIFFKIGNDNGYYKETSDLNEVKMALRDGLFVGEVKVSAIHAWRFDH